MNSRVIAALTALIFWALTSTSRSLADEIYVSDSFGGVITYSGNGALGTVSYGGGVAKGMVFDTNGDLYIANQSSGMIDVVSPGGAVKPYATLNYPGSALGGMTIDTYGNLYVSITSFNVIDEISSSGVVSTYATGIPTPQGIAVDSDGNLYAGSHTGGAIYKVNRGGGAAVQFAIDKVSVEGIAIDSSGNIYAAVNDQSIQKFTPWGAWYNFANVPYCQGIQFDSKGDLYVACHNPQYVGFLDEVAPSGQVMSVLGPYQGLMAPSYIAVSAQVPEPDFKSFILIASVLSTLIRR